MAIKNKYKYNPSTLSMEKIERKGVDYVKLVVVVTAVFALVGVVSIFIYNSLFDSPQEKQLQSEVHFLENQIQLLQKDIDTLAYIAQDLQKKDDEIYRNIFGAEQYPKHLREGGIGGADRYKHLNGFESSSDLIETKKRISSLQRKLVAQSKSLEELYHLAQNKSKMLACIPAIQPIANGDLTRLASGFGMRMHPIYKVPKMHTGLDFSAPTGTEIYASGDGVVSRVEHKLTGYGTNVTINHGYGFQSLYAHMIKSKVREGQKVKRGELIGFVGSTGTSVAPHLHYEVMKNNEKVDPANYFFNDLTPEQFEELIERSQMGNQSFD